MICFLMSRNKAPLSFSDYVLINITCILNATPTKSTYLQNILKGCLGYYLYKLTKDNISYYSESGVIRKQVSNGQSKWEAYGT